MKLYMNKWQIFTGIFLSCSLCANPSSPEVIAGEASFQASPNTLQVHTSDLAIIQWEDFSISENELTQFIQPNEQSAVLNRVLIGNPSQLLGKLEANGHIYLINPNGIFVGEGAEINTNNFIAQTHDLADDLFLSHDFSQGPLFVSPNEYTSAIRHSGTISAMNLQEEGGHVYLMADEIEINGTIESPGGEVRILGNHINLDDTLIDVSGPIGGTVMVGGDYQGNNPDILNATQVRATEATVIRANALESGNGGKIVVWADDSMTYHGRLEARGGSQEGDGGFIEVSGKIFLDYQGFANTMAPYGKTGILLLDPFDLDVIDPNQFATTTGIIRPTGTGTPAQINPATITGNLAGSNVIVESLGGAGSENGNINILTDIGPYASANSLTFRTNNLSTSPAVTNGNINVAAGVTISNTGTGSIFFDSVQDINVGDAASLVATLIRVSGAGATLNFTAGRDMNVIAGAAGTGDVTIETTISPLNDISISVGGDLILTGGGGFPNANISAAGAFFGDIAGNCVLGTDSVTGFITSSSGIFSMNVGNSLILVENGLVRGNSSISMEVTVGQDIIIGISSDIRSITGSGPFNVIAGRDIILNDDGSNFTTIEIRTGPSLIFAGRNLEFKNGATIESTAGTSETLILQAGQDIIMTENGVFDIRTNGLFRLEAGRNVIINGPLAGYNNTNVARPTSVEILAGNDFVLADTARFRTLGAGSMTFFAGRNISLRDSSTLSTASGDVTLITDNKNPSPGEIGNGGFQIASGVTLSSGTGALRIFTASRDHNMIDGFLNGTPFTPGPEFQNTSLEMWGIYFPHNTGFPYTIFYKDFLTPYSFLQAFVTSAYEYLQWMDHFDRYNFLLKTFTWGKAKKLVQKHQHFEYDLDEEQKYTILEQLFLIQNFKWFDPSFSEAE